MRVAALLLSLLVVLSGCSMLGGPSSPESGTTADDPGTAERPVTVTSVDADPGDGPTGQGTTVRSPTPDLDLPEYDPGDPVGRAIASDERPVIEATEYPQERFTRLRHAEFAKVGETYYRVESVRREPVRYEVTAERASRTASGTVVLIADLPVEAREVVQAAIAGGYYSTDPGPSPAYLDVEGYERERFGTALDADVYVTANGTRYSLDRSFAMVARAYSVRRVDPENVSREFGSYADLSEFERRVFDRMLEGGQVRYSGNVEFDPQLVVYNGTHYRVVDWGPRGVGPILDHVRLHVEAERVDDETAYEAERTTDSN